MLALIAALAAPPALAHGGGLDSRGCHNDTAAGEYHCHDGSQAGQAFSSESAYPGAGGSADSASARGGAYDRDDYHPRWLDRDGDCRDTREEVLIAESLTSVEFETDRQCNVVAGTWHDPYSGRTFRDPSDLDIDHLVPLAEAHRSGAGDWPDQRKHRYANDLEHAHTLIAVHLGENRSKGSRDPAEWMPSNASFHCTYLQRWVEIKRVWGLSMDPDERGAIEQGMRDCE